MKNLTSILFLLFLGQWLSGQIAPNFTITDSDGKEHHLYEDYLDQGKIVVIKMFFVDCPICKPYNEPFQNLYEELGAGEDSVEFLLLSTKSWDSNEDVQGYKEQYGLTFPAAGNDGGAFQATAPYRNGDFGTFFGSPTFIVIEPDKTVHFDIAASGVEATLTKVKEKVVEIKNQNSGMAEGTRITINVIDYKGEELPPYSLILRSSTQPDSFYMVPDSFTYPSAQFPVLDSAVISMEINEFSKKGISTIDIVIIQRHILQILTLDPFQLLAADVNDSGTVSTADLLSIRKLILQLKDEFKVGKSWQAIDSRCGTSSEYCKESIPILMNLDQQNIDFTVIKYGDVK
ncbi:redoxin domain-containing protein [Portibacter marinus]|uniref:redoxin domain-containing protein n=1 Tax=Portibacter marinus TaxID=2898660 RepID=UPI001F1E61D6|nr:redoxin domain-containing protein [Portibacter marinus]